MSGTFAQGGTPDLQEGSGQGTEPEDEDVEGKADAAAEIKDPFDPTTIRIDTKSITVDLIMKRMDRGEIDLNPDFQRNAGVWNRIGQSRLIESLLLRIPIPVFYMAADREDRWQVVDGLQRLDALRSFVLEKRLELRGLEYLEDFEKRSYDQLPRPMQRRIDETELYCHVIQPGTPPEVMFNVFKRINTGGKPLLPQEIRHALYPGPARNFINEMAKDPEFLSATGRSVSSKRMADRECVLRFVAFHRGRRDYQGNLNAFLVNAMKALNDMAGASELTALREGFRGAMRLATELFGDEAFRRPAGADERRKPINKPLFEAWSVNLAGFRDPWQRRRLVERKDRVRDGFKELMRDEEFEQSISIGTQWRTRVEIRFRRIEDLLRKAVA